MRRRPFALPSCFIFTHPYAAVPAMAVRPGNMEGYSQETFCPVMETSDLREDTSLSNTWRLDAQTMWEYK